MAKVRIVWEHDVPKNVKKVIQKTVEGLWEASRLATDVIGNESHMQTPIDTGTLRRSWFTKPLLSKIGFGFGYRTPYAARLHEHPEYKFKTPGTKAKYLEDPIEQNLGDWQGKFLSKLKSVTQ
jgi:hypothetical protein